MNAASVKKSLQLGPECPHPSRAGAGTPHASSALEELVSAPQIVTCTGSIGPNICCLHSFPSPTSSAATEPSSPAIPMPVANTLAAELRGFPQSLRS